MSFGVEYHPVAAAEFVDALAWYEQQNLGLGDRFSAAFEATLKQRLAGLRQRGRSIKQPSFSVPTHLPKSVFSAFPPT